MLYFQKNVFHPNWLNMTHPKVTLAMFVGKCVETCPLPGSTWSLGTSLTLKVITVLFVTSFVRLRMPWLATRLSVADQLTKCNLTLRRSLLHLVYKSINDILREENCSYILFLYLEGGGDAQNVDVDSGHFLDVDCRLKGFKKCRIYKEFFEK